jgi:hypothetical protein
LVWVAGPIFLLEEIPSLLVHVLVLHCIEARPGSIFAEVSSALGLACRFSPEARRRTQSSSSISFSVLAPVFSYRRAAADSFVFLFSRSAPSRVFSSEAHQCSAPPQPGVLVRVCDLAYPAVGSVPSRASNPRIAGIRRRVCLGLFAPISLLLPRFPCGVRQSLGGRSVN